MRTKVEENNVIIYLENRIDSNNTVEVQTELESIIDANPGKEPVIDAMDLNYISSAGLRVLLKITKTLKKPLSVYNVSPEIYEIFEMTGFKDLLNIKKKLRELSIDGCEVIGRGAIGTVYRIDDDTVVKVYNIPDCLPMIENEQKRAKQAFLKGIPTAISYDVVKVGDNFGSVFEMLKASTYNDLIVEQPERTDEIVRQYAKFIRQLHDVEMDAGELPQAKEQFIKYLDDLKEVLPEALQNRLLTLLQAMPENLHFVHGDIQMKNVMLSGDEPMLIDMDTISSGDPVFDLMGVYLAYIQFGEDDPADTEKFLGITAERARYIWHETLRNYLGNADDAVIDAAEKKIIIVSSIRFLFLIAALGIGEPELKQLRIEHTLTRLSRLAEEVDSLELAER